MKIRRLCFRVFSLKAEGVTVTKPRVAIGVAPQQQATGLANLCIHVISPSPRWGEGEEWPRHKDLPDPLRGEASEVWGKGRFAHSPAPACGTFRFSTPPVIA